jgi:hypothetical protein
MKFIFRNPQKESRTVTKNPNLLARTFNRFRKSDPKISRVSGHRIIVLTDEVEIIDLADRTEIIDLTDEVEDDDPREHMLGLKELQIIALKFGIELMDGPDGLFLSTYVECEKKYLGGPYKKVEVIEETDGRTNSVKLRFIGSMRYGEQTETFTATEAVDEKNCVVIQIAWLVPSPVPCETPLWTIDCAGFRMMFGRTIRPFEAKTPRSEIRRCRVLS